MDRENVLILQYLRNITSKVSVLIERMAILEKKVISLGQAAGTAFHQVRDATVKLAACAEQTREDLASYGGVIESESFFNGC